MKKTLTRFSVALALLMSSLAVLAQGKRPPTTPPASAWYCDILFSFLHAPEAVLVLFDCVVID